MYSFVPAEGIIVFALNFIDADFFFSLYLKWNEISFLSSVWKVFFLPEDKPMMKALAANPGDSESS